MRRLWLIIFGLIASVSALAQETDDDYYLYKLESEPRWEFSFSTDTLLFYRVLHTNRDLYDELSSYRFSMVRSARRGLYYTSRRALLEGVELRHSNMSLLRRLGVAERGFAGLTHNDVAVAGAAGVDCYTLSEQRPVSGGSAALFFSGKDYLGGVRASLHSLMRRGWSMSLYAAAKGGNDLYVDGVYNNAVDVGLRLTKEFSAEATLSLVALSTAGERGLRSGSTQEAFTLTGDNLYNPTWGLQSGDVRNSRRRREAVPFVALSLDMPIGGSSRMNITFGGDYGRRGYTSLGWYDAMTPRPDNYRYMPSYFADEHIAAGVAEEWRRRNERYTQINWDDLYTQNRRSTDGAVYALEERVERIARGQLSLRMTTDVGQNISLEYGVRAWNYSSRNYKQMDDLLGAAYLLDIDYYLIDDDTYSQNLQNNLLQPDRRVGEGDRFSYDYALVDRGVMADVAFTYLSSRWQVDVALAAGRREHFRRGYFEKEQFAADKSFGRSAVVGYAPYAAKVGAGYAFSAHHHLGVVAMASAQAPSVEDIFLNPQYNNRVVDNPDMSREVSAEINYKYRTSALDMVLSLYMAQSRDERMTFRAYDDLSTTYCDVDVRGIGVSRYGVEASLRWQATEHLQVEATAAYGEYRYSATPVVSHYADTDNAIVCDSSPSYMGDCRVGGAPQLLSSAQLTYFARRGWILSGAANYAGGRWVEPSFVRRTERVARQGAASEEIYRQFLSQQRLSDVVTVDASLARWFWVGRSRMSVSLMVRNLLGSDDIVYGGYESSRIRRYRSGAQMVYAPQDDVITYAYPRTFYAVVSWKF